MGGVELLSREGEIAIAKRIEAGKDVMLNALSQSPITAQQFFEWDSKLQKDEILVREIIDIDTNYMEYDSSDEGSKQKKNNDLSDLPKYQIGSPLSDFWEVTYELSKFWISLFFVTVGFSGSSTKNQVLYDGYTEYCYET